VSNHDHERDGSIDRLLTISMPRGAIDPSARCLDEQTLAEWADDGLTRAERAAVETHAADCDRCQAMMAAMATIAAASGADRSKRSASRSRLLSWRWLVPATAAAAIVLALVLVPNRNRPPAPREERQVAESARGAVPPQTLPDRAANAPVASEPASREKAVRRDKQSFTPRREVATDKKTAAAPAADAFERSADAELQKNRLADQVAAAAPQAAPVAPRTSVATNALAMGTAQALIVSPDPAIRWRIVPGGAVERSGDGGATWQTQSTGATETLAAGASPSASVCWLVGSRGTVLLSTDGRSWHRLVFPEAIPLVAVRAADDKAATVTAADGRAFVTIDGGQTWTPQPR
jgi:hypothetical protein